MSRVFANGPGDQGSIPGRVIQTSENGTRCLFYTQYNKERIKGKVDQSREWSSALSCTPM